VANAAGDVFPAPLEETTDEQWARSIAAKWMGQINVVRAALPHIADRGSFTLVSGLLTDEFTPASSIGTTVNHMVEGFVKAAATEMPRGVPDQLHQPHGPGGIGGLPSLLPRIHAGSGRRGCAGLSPRHVEPDQWADPQTPQDRELTGHGEWSP
jgi:hypothetical protein